MADPNYEVKENPTYDPEIRKLKNTDLAHATTVFNPFFEQVINNLHAVKLEAENRSLYQLELLFVPRQVGQSVLVIGGSLANFKYTGVVPDDLVLRINVPHGNVEYNIFCDAQTRKIVPGNFYGIYRVSFSSLNERTWEEIARISENGEAEDYFNVGDEKDLVLTTGETLTVQIFGFNHDETGKGDKVGITFGLKHLSEMRRMNSFPYGLNRGGYLDTEMYRYLNETLKPLLPFQLRMTMKTVLKKTGLGCGVSTIQEADMVVFLFSEVEWFGGAKVSTTGEGKRYAIFADRSNRIKRLQNGDGMPTNWWLRSPHKVDPNLCCFVQPEGTIYNANINEVWGVCFGFCI